MASSLMFQGYRPVARLLLILGRSCNIRVLYEDADCTYSTGGANLAKSRDRVERLLCSTIRNTIDKRSLKHENRERYGSRPASLSAVKITRVRPRPNDSKVKLCVRGKLARLNTNAKSRKAFLV
jgi:hypothetical protein